MKINIYAKNGQATFDNDNATELWQAIDEEVGDNDFIGYKGLSEERQLEWQQDLDDTQSIEYFLQDAKKRGFIDNFVIED